MVDAVPAGAGRDEQQAAGGQGADQLEATLVDEDALAEVDEQVGAEHVQDDQGGDHGNRDAEHEGGTADELDDPGEPGGEGRHRYAGLVEERGGALDAVLEQLLPAVGDQDDAEEHSTEQQRDIGERGWDRHGERLSRRDRAGPTAAVPTSEGWRPWVAPSGRVA